MPRPGSKHLTEQPSALGHLSSPPVGCGGLGVDPYYGRYREPDFVVYYLERANGHIKIGCTSNYPRRRHELMKQHGPLSLVAWEEGDSQLEFARHRQFAGLRVNPIAEWFEPGESLIDWILNIRALMA